MTDIDLPVAHFPIKVGKFPASSFTQEELSDGLVVLPIIGIIYLFIGLYILNRKYFYPTIEHFIHLIDGTHAPVAYCMLNNAIYFFIMLYSTLLAKDSIGISTIVGSDAMCFLFAMGIFQWRLKDHYQMEPWIFLKEGTFYLGNLLLAVIFFSFDEFVWWMAIAWLIYFGAYTAYFQGRNEDLRDKLIAALGLKSDDVTYSSDDNYKMKKRRYSLSEIASEVDVNFEDPEFLMKVKRQEASLMFQLTDHSKYRTYARFQRLVHLVIYAIQNKIQFEKKKRSQIFHDRVENKGPRKQKTVLSEQKSQKQEEEQNIQNEDATLLMKNEDVIQIDEDINEEANSKRFGGSDMQSSQANRRKSKQRTDEMAIISNFSLSDRNQPNVNVPDSIIGKILYVFLFPLNFLFYIMLFHFKKKVTFNFTAFSLITILIIQAGFSFLIIWWSELVCVGFSIDSELAGISWTAVGFSLSFLVYNFKFQSQNSDANFLITYEMIGIYKFGCAAALGWFLGFILNGQGSVSLFTNGFFYTTIIYFVLFIGGSAWIGLNKFKVSKKMSLPFIGGYLLFLVVGIILTDKMTEM